MTHIIENVSRRFVLKGVLAGGGLVLAARILPGTALAEGRIVNFDYLTGATDRSLPGGVVSDPHVFVSIAPDGTVTIIAARSEMGTGAAHTSLPMILADHMEADWDRVKIVQGEGNLKYGNQDTDGSRSVRHWLRPMAECGTAARTMLETAAAARWKVAVSEVAASNHAVVHKPSGRKLGYGELAADAAALPSPAAETLVFKDPATFRYIGKGKVAIVDLNDIVTGQALYGSDHRLPGMKYAVIARPPVLNATLVSYDVSATLAVPGVEKVVQVKGWEHPPEKVTGFRPVGGLAVIASNTGAAIKGRDALKIVWDDGANASYDSDTYKGLLTAGARQPARVMRNQGDVAAAFQSAKRVVSAEYYTAALAHATMEPPSALANVANGKVEVWAPVQSPFWCQGDLAEMLDLPADSITVNPTLLGGAFGRKSKCDFVLEAALLSRDLGVPIQVHWTREDDLRNGYYHAPALERIEASVDASNKVTGWLHRVCAPTIDSSFEKGAKYLAPPEKSMGILDMPFDIPNIRAEDAPADAHTRIGWFRSVWNIPHAFAIQSFVAELADALRRDPKDFLLELIGPPRIVDVRTSIFGDLWDYGDPWSTYPVDAGRWGRVVEVGADKAGWGRKLPAGQGMGIAAHRSFVSYVATVVRVEVDAKGNLSISQVDTAIDCGFHVNPERIASQIEGAAVMGTSLARFSEITFRGGRVQQGNFDGYRVARIDEVPRVTNVHIIPAGPDVPASGVGEPGTPTFAPALCNAIFAATGKRIRSLPIGDQLAA